MKLPVFYTPKMAAESDGYSPSGMKPKLVIDDWRKKHKDKITTIAFNPVTRDDLKLAHEPAFVDGVLDGILPNGFGTQCLRIANTLPYTTGSMLSAAKHVLSIPEDRRQGVMVACSPTSGFHHAHHAQPSGFCTFNGLIVTAMKLKNLRMVERVGILDLDQHYGDGTESLIKKHGLDWITHITATKGYSRDADDIKHIRQLVKQQFGHLNQGGVLLYQAGADSHIHDPMGGYLTTEQMRKRDADVFWTCMKYSIPLVWNLAGGYQRDHKGGIEPVLKLHRNTMLACHETYFGALQ